MPEQNGRQEFREGQRNENWIHSFVHPVLNVGRGAETPAVSQSSWTRGEQRDNSTCQGVREERKSGPGHLFPEGKAGPRPEAARGGGEEAGQECFFAGLEEGCDPAAQGRKSPRQE